MMFLARVLEHRKMPGAGGGGYLVLVVDDVKAFREKHPEAIELTIRRK